MAVRAARQRLSKADRRGLTIGLILISPWLLGFLLWTCYPLGASVYYSLTRYDLLSPPVFIGLANFREIFTSADVALVAKNTLWWVALSAPLGMVSAFLMANLLNTRITGRSFFRAIFFFPSIVPAVVTAMIWTFLLNAQYGAINATLSALGLRTIPFLSSPTAVRPTLILIHMWAQGSAMVIFLATLQDVPRSLYDAAMIDGANGFRRFWHVTIPMCSPVVLFNLVMGFIGGFQYFTMPWLLTQGGPNRATEFYSLHLYRNAFLFLRMGKAAALAWLLFVVVVVFTITLFKTSGRWVYYGGEAD
jgi:multiple sugar transport system permease protein